MSLVGPRPEQVELVERYEDEHRFRLVVKPGLTGPMQVFGRGELTFDERLAVEREYIENLSIGRDLRMLAMTVRAVVTGGARSDRNAASVSVVIPSIAATVRLVVSPRARSLADRAPGRRRRQRARPAVARDLRSIGVARGGDGSERGVRRCREPGGDDGPTATCSSSSTTTSRCSRRRVSPRRGPELEGAEWLRRSRQAEEPDVVASAGIELDGALNAHTISAASARATRELAAPPFGPCGVAAGYHRRAFLEVGGLRRRVLRVLGGRRPRAAAARRRRTLRARCRCAGDACRLGHARSRFAREGRHRRLQPGLLPTEVRRARLTTTRGAGARRRGDRGRGARRATPLASPGNVAAPRLA